MKANKIKQDEVCEHVTGIGKIKNKNKILQKSFNGRDHLKDLGVYEKIILKWVIKK